MGKEDLHPITELDTSPVHHVPDTGRIVHMEKLSDEEDRILSKMLAEQVRLDHMSPSRRLDEQERFSRIYNDDTRDS
jgi:hypothetical protein